MKNVTVYNFIEEIAKDFNLDIDIKIITKYNQFPLKNGKRKISSSNDAIIVDKQENEFPYMLDQHNRNNDKLINFDYIYVIRPKPLHLIIEQAGLKLRMEKCKICEGSGWYSWGTRYYYKDLICEQ